MAYYQAIILAIGLFTLNCPRISADVIALYNDPSFVDTSPAGSAASLQAQLELQGHTIQSFSGTSDTDFAAGLAGAEAVVFPHLLNFGALSSALDSAARDTINDYVGIGHGLIVTGSNAHTLLNAVFYAPDNFLASTGSAGPDTLIVANASGTPYQDGPTQLGAPPAPNGALNPFAFTPPGALNLYEDAVGNITVMVAPIDHGKIGYLAWDYAGATPIGSLDGGWNAVLGTTVTDFAAIEAIPEPTTLGLMAVVVGLISVLAKRRPRPQLTTTS